MPRETLTRDAIVRAAIALLDADGIDGLSMRRLGAELGTAATTVYWHVPSKEALVVLAADEVWGEVTVPDATSAEWRSALTTVAHDIYAMTLRHPWVVPASSSSLITGPRMARSGDRAYAIMERAGFVGADVERAFNTLTTYVLGAAMGDAAEIVWRTRLERSDGDTGAGGDQSVHQARALVADHPRLLAHLDDVAAADPAEARRSRFEFGLEVVLDGLERRQR